ncbi:MFS transporter [Dactylosporangium sp. CA-139066]|uniref:MFS transporter n=1 Tax=Dactylosporangium sp. CA-139066 TaxID=3239930 RepID=UPI003D8EB684
MNRWWVLAVLCLAEFVVVLDNTLLNVAVPTLSRELSTGTAGVQWIINAYALAQAGLLLAGGAAADRYGRRRMLLLGLAVFGAGSLAAGLAGSVAALVAARVVMGAGGALLITATLAVAVQLFDAAERPRAIGAWAAVSALGFAGGPVVGGLVLAHLPWNALFLGNVPVVLAGLAAVAALVPESRNPRAGRPDLLGALLATAGTTAVVYAVIAAAPALAAPGLLLLALFVLWQRRARWPMLNLALFRSRRFTGAVTGIVLITFGSAGALFLLTLQLQVVGGLTPLAAGLRMAPFALSVVALNATGASARAIRALGRAAAVLLGMALLAAGLCVVARFAVGGYPPMLAGLLLMGAGCALANPAIVEAVLGAVPPDEAGAGAGIEGTMTELGTALGVAALGAVLQALLPASGPARALELSQFAGAAAVLLGGGVTAALLRGRA